MTQAQLAERTGLTRVGVAQLETGRRKPAWETVLVLCQALGVDCNAFTEQPAADQAEAKPGRPRKATGAGQSEPEKPKPRRKRK